MRRASFDKYNNRSIVNTSSYGLTSANKKDAEFKCSVTYSSLQEKNCLQRSISADNVVIRSRGFKPSDRHDPIKRNFLENLTSKILHFDMESGEATPINLQKLLTPASDSHEFVQTKNKKMFASSYFYAPTHPTVEDQVELARRISHSLSDVKNMKSKGQSMYVNRKKRSVKWIHDGNGIEDEEESSTPIHKEKMPLKCLMNPSGKVLDIHGIQALGEEVNIEPMPSHPEKLFDIVRDLNTQKGRGAEIFAKRRKRSEKWVVDQEQPQTPSTPITPKTPTYPTKLDMNGHTKLPSLSSSLPPLTPAAEIDKPFYNPFTVDIALGLTNPATTTGNNRQCYENTKCTHSTEVKKIYLREVAVGTDADFPIEKSQSSVEKTKRFLNESTNALPANANSNRRHNKLSSNKSNNSTTLKATNKEIRTQSKQRHTEELIQRVSKASDSEDSVYTPVPVKQLIQEFEKTCRPVLQYKQISPKVIPIIQQCPIDNDIARFFETRSTTKYDREDEYTRVTAPREEYEDAGKFQSGRCNGYVSTDETEYTTDETDSESNEYPPLYRENNLQSSVVNGSREYANFYRSEYSDRRQSATSQELEDLCRNGDVKYVNSDSEIPVEAKSLLLSMVASQEDILETIKHLRNTPVLDNLLHGASPDCNFNDVYPQDVGNKLYSAEEETTYSGPKIGNIQSLANYNTAPRGWDQSLTYYRPIKFEKQQIVYSDF